MNMKIYSPSFLNSENVEIILAISVVFSIFSELKIYQNYPRFTNFSMRSAEFAKV